MRWLILLAGLVLAFAGSAGAAALVTTARRSIAEAISRRLRGGVESLSWLTTIEREVVAASAAASFGVALVGAAIPGVFDGVSLFELALLIFFLVVPATLLGGYLLPRWLTVPRAARAVDQLRPLLSGWSAMLGLVLPTRAPDPADDIRALAREGSASGLDGEELVMVGGVMTFAERPVREVMTPRTAVVAASHDAAWPDILNIFTESGYTRIPVYRNTLDEILGMLHAIDVFTHQPDDPLPLRPVSFTPETQPAGDLLLAMQRGRQHLGVVLDEFGGTAGIVTLEDLLEALVGEISDEDDAPPLLPASSAEMIEVDGSVAPSVIEEHFRVSLPGRGAASFGGLLADMAGRIPAAGERFSIRGLDVDIVQASPTRVERLLVRRGIPASVELDRAAG